MTTAIKVDQKDGEVRIAYGGIGETQVYKVDGGKVSVEDRDVPAFLALIPGSAIVGNPASNITPVTTPAPAAPTATP